MTIEYKSDEISKAILAQEFLKGKGISSRLLCNQPVSSMEMLVERKLLVHRIEVEEVDSEGAQQVLRFFGYMGTKRLEGYPL